MPNTTSVRSMIFDPLTQVLYASDGQAVAQVNCPAGLTPTELQPNADGSRHCSSCKRDIVNVGDMTEQAFLQLLRGGATPRPCVFATGLRRHLIRLHGSPVEAVPSDEIGLLGDISPFDYN